MRAFSCIGANTCVVAPADAKMSRKRVQLSDLDRKKICQLAHEHTLLSQDKLTALLQTQLNKPELALGTVEEVIKAPSLHDARQQLQGLPVVLADNPQFSAEDEMLLQMLATKVSKMTVSRISQSCQQNITAFFSSS